MLYLNDKANTAQKQREVRGIINRIKDIFRYSQLSLDNLYLRTYLYFLLSK